MRDSVDQPLDDSLDRVSEQRTLQLIKVNLAHSMSLHYSFWLSVTISGGLRQLNMFLTAGTFI